MQSTLGHKIRRSWAVASAIAVVMAVSGAWSVEVAAAPSTAGFGYFRTDLPALANRSTSILSGKKLANGACRYANVDAETEVPLDGWVERTIALDPDGCRKLIEAGTPTIVSPAGVDGMESSRSVASPAAPEGPSTNGGESILSTKSAYIRIFWMDVVNLKVNQDVTQINWTYNGSTVSGGITTGFWNWLSATGWSKYASNVTGLYGPGSTYYRGQTTSDFKNSSFCWPLPTVYTHYYYVRMWGHPNGTATWSQSSDSVDECFPFHWDKLTAYGTFPGF